MNARFICLLVSLATVSFANAAQLEEVANFPASQVTGVTASKTGRVFVNFPDWGDEHPMSVAEIVDGQPKPYPNAEWNTKGDPKSTFICVQSVVVDANDQLWILDPAAPKMQSIVKGGPKLVKVDLKTNAVVQTIPFGEDVASGKSYLNDVRIDTEANVAFLTDSGKGALVVVDLTSGKARRLLDGHKSTQAESGFKLSVNGRELRGENGQPPQINSDGIALTKDGYLYFHALTAHTLYRIKSDYLKDAELKESEVEAHVENLGQTPACDGMIEAPDGSIYLTNIETSGVVRFDPTTKQITTVIEDAARLLWPDTLSWGPDNSLYVTASQIENMPRFNGGKSARHEPYRLFKITGAR
ncbi:MAG: major royal jelly family protein [Verrucomicrobiota bacterium]|nr:major royal jelly family protein [Verrucomicrobiota bacterium]